jgi:hypothetical protein
MRRARMRQPVATTGAPAELTEQQRADKTLERMSQNLKLIDIKRGVIRINTKRLPFLYAGLAIFGLPLAGAVLALSPILIFLFGALFSAVAANTFGPIGAIERRKDSIKEIERLRAAVGTDLFDLPEGVNPQIFGFRRATKTELALTEQCIDLKTMQMQDIDEKGTLPFAPYKSLGMFFRAADGAINLAHPAIKNQYWLIEARLKGLSDETILKALAQYA